MSHRTITAACLAVAFASATLAPTPAAAQARNAFDGTWSVRSTTQSGTCASRSFNISIEDGEISFGPFTATGGVGARGRVNASYAALGNSLNSQGRLTSSRGGGTWTSPTRNCSGRWSAQRAAA